MSIYINKTALLLSDILKLVLAGKMGEAIERTFKLYPGLLENNQNLLFMLKCRQFVEMINGSDLDYSLKKNCSDSNNGSSQRPSSPVMTSVIQSTKTFTNKQKQHEVSGKLISEDYNTELLSFFLSSYMNASFSISIPEMNQTNALHKGNFSDSSVIAMGNSDVEMDETEESQNGHGDSVNKSNISTNGFQNGNSHVLDSRDVHHTCDINDDEVMGEWDEVFSVLVDILDHCLFID